MAKSATARSKTRGANIPVPQSREEAAGMIARLGVLRREIARTEADLNDEIAALKTSAEKAVAPLSEEADALTEGVKTWCEANRSRLTDGGKTKTADLGTGTISWRLRPPSVTVRGVDTVIDALKALGFSRFVRVKEEVNKDAMRAEADVARTVPGVSIGSPGEDFVVEPFEVELAAGGAS